MKTPVYKTVTVYSWDRDDVILEEVSSIQQHEENPMIPERVKKQQVQKEGASSPTPVLKLATST